MVCSEGKEYVVSGAAVRSVANARYIYTKWRIKTQDGSWEYGTPRKPLGWATNRMRAQAGTIGNIIFPLPVPPPPPPPACGVWYCGMG